MQITHEEARHLIQFKMDRSLKPQEINTLQTHLTDCGECRTFAEELKEMENLLAPIMKSQWMLQPVPLSIAAITKKRSFKLASSVILTTRTALISLAFAAFVFGAWQFAFANSESSTPMPVGALPVPTPSSQSTSTKISFSDCQGVVYRVQKNDTLSSIASQFSTAIDKIMAVNHMSSEIVTAGMELLIPICNSTPTGTVHPSTVTITYTPLLRQTTATPDG
jgi:predicted anti-sigma-YlaC factor YlaD